MVGALNPDITAYTAKPSPSFFFLSSLLNVMLGRDIRKVVRKGLQAENALCRWQINQLFEL